MLMQRKTTTPTLWNGNGNTSTTDLSTWIDEVFEDALNWPLASNHNFVPELNVYETDKEFEVMVALPGMNKKDIEINYDGGLLTISGERRMEKPENAYRYHKIESRFGKFRRSLPMPEDVVNEEKITAKFENGVLYVTVPKMKEKAAKKIAIS